MRQWEEHIGETILNGINKNWPSEDISVLVEERHGCHSAKIDSKAIDKVADWYSRRAQDVANYIRQPGNWGQQGNLVAEIAGDLAPEAVAEVVNCSIKVRYADGLQPYVINSKAPDCIEVIYDRKRKHYDAWLKNEKIQVRGDGDCLFAAVQCSMGDGDPQNAHALRELVANEVRDNWHKYVDCLVPDQRKKRPEQGKEQK